MASFDLTSDSIREPTGQSQKVAASRFQTHRLSAFRAVG